MPLFKRSRPAPSPSHDAPFSLTLFETSYHLRASSPQPLHLLHLTKNIASNLPEAHPLLSLKSSLLHPKDLGRITSVIADTEAALHDIAQLIRPARVARPRAAILDLPLFDNNSHNNNKSTWLLEDSPHVRDLHSRLSLLHGSLMSVLSVLYLSDLRWVFVAAKPEPEPPQYEREASPPAYVSIDPVAVVVEKSLEKAVKQQSHIWNGPQTSRIPPTAARFAIDNPYTWQPPSPPPPEEGKLQHSRSDPTPHLQHPAYPDGFKHRLYKHENISSSYLKGCRLTTPWTTEFVVSGEEEGEGESGSSIRDDGGGDGLELPPRLSTLVKRRWSSDVLRGGGGGVCE